MHHNPFRRGAYSFADVRALVIALATDPRFYFWLGLFFALACVFKAVPSRPLYMWISSDTLWPVDLFIDVFRDGYSFSGWEFSIAPCWFPDIAIIGLCYLFLRNPNVTTLVGGAILFILLIAGLCLCWRALRLRHRQLLEVLTVGTGITLVLWIAYHTDTFYPAFYRFLLPQTHVGNLVMHIYAVWLGILVIALPAGRKRTVALYGFAVTCFLAGLSNLMFFPHTLVPLSLGLAIIVAAKTVSVRNAATVLLIGWPATVAGAIADRLIFPAMGVGAESSISYRAWRTAITTFYDGMAGGLARFDLQHVAGAVWLICCLVLGWALLSRGQAADDRKWRGLIALFFLTCAGASVLGPVAIIFGGNVGLTQFKDYMWSMHYLHPTFLLPLLAWPSLAGFVREIRTPRITGRALAASSAALGLGIPVVAYARIPDPAIPLSQWVPDFVRVLDHNSKTYGTRYGVAGYWQARLITVFSKTGLRAYPVDGTLQPLLFVANREWYTESLQDHSKKPCFSYAVLNDPLWKLSRGAVVSRIGPPSYEVDAAGVPVLFYTDGAFGHVMPRCTALFDSAGARTSGRVDRPLTSYASSMSSPAKFIQVSPAATVDLTVDLSNKGTEPWSSSGTWPVTLSYKWIKDGRMLPIEGKRTGLPGVIAPGATATVSASVIAPPEPGSYVLRFSLVQEGITWFISSGGVPLDIPVSVTTYVRGRPPLPR